MKTKHYRKLTKALAMMQRAQELVNEVAAADREFRYSCNANFRENRIEAAVSILGTEIENHTPQDNAPSYNKTWESYRAFVEEDARRNAWAAED